MTEKKQREKRPMMRDDQGRVLNKDGSLRRSRGKHTPETKAKISERRKARSLTNPPRNASQSKRSQSLYGELKKEYKSNKEVMAWLEANKEGLGHLEGEKFRDVIFEKTRDMGIITEYTEMYNKVYFDYVGDILYSEDGCNNEVKSYDPWDFVEVLDQNKSIEEVMWNK